MNTLAVDTPSQWLAEVAIHAASGRHVIVVGAERDRVYDGVGLVEPAAALAEQLARMNRFAQVLQWSPSRHPLNTPEPVQPGEPADGLALELLQRMQSAEERTALIIESAELVCRTLSPVGVDAIRRALALPTGPSGKPVIVLLVSDPAELPVELHGDTRLARVQVARPDHLVRRSVLASLAESFYEWDEDCLDELSVLTDGMSLSEAEALAQYSRVRQVPAREPRILVARYRAGLGLDPWDALDHARLAEAHTTLGRGVLGQEDVVKRVVEKLRTARVGLSFTSDSTSGTRRPRMTMFLVGPTGVGKTELVRTLAEYVFGDRNAIIRLDMAEYQSAHAAERLGGAPPGYVGYGDPSIADQVAQRPFSVVLFDEIEKAADAVWDRLLAILDDGRLTDGRGQTVSFGNTIVAFTSNLGAKEVADKGAPGAEQLRKDCIKAVRDHLVDGLNRPELWGRLEDSVIAFDALRPPVVAPMVGKLLGGLRASARERYDLELDVDEAELARVATELARGRRDGTWSGRTVRADVEKLVLEPLSDELLRCGLSHGGTMRVGPRAGKES